MANKIQSIRESIGITRVELAKKSKLALSKIYLYESGKGNPTTKTINKIAKALNCEPKDLI